MFNVAIPAGKHTRKASLVWDKNTLQQSDLQVTQKEKKRHQRKSTLGDTKRRSTP